MPIQKTITLLERVNSQPRSTVVVGAVAAQILICVADWLSRPNVPLDVLYFLPYIVLCFTGISRAKVIILGCLLASIRIFYFIHFNPQRHMTGQLFGSALATVIAFIVTGLVVRKMSLDSSLLRRFTRDVEERDRRYALLIATSPAGVITINAQHVVTEANDAVHRMLDYTTGEIVGKSVSEFFPALAAIPLSHSIIPLSTTMKASCCKRNGSHCNVSIVFSTFYLHGPVIAAIIIDTEDEDTLEAVPLKASSFGGSPVLTMPTGPARRELTFREAQVLRMICKGLQNKQIAENVGISDHAVKATVQRLYDKLNIEERTRPALVSIVMQRHQRFLAQGVSAS